MLAPIISSTAPGIIVILMVDVIFHSHVDFGPPNYKVLSTEEYELVL